MDETIFRVSGGISADYMCNILHFEEGQRDSIKGNFKLEESEVRNGTVPFVEKVLIL